MRLLRGSLVILAWVIFFGYLSALLLNILMTNFTNFDRFSTFIFAEMSYFFVTLPLPALLIWAAHNLGSSAFSSKFVRWILKVSLWLTIAGAIVLLAQTIMAHMTDYPTYAPTSISNFLETANYYIYTLGEICLLVFASKQMTQKQEGEALKAIPETHIVKKAVNKVRGLGDKTDLQEK